MQPRTLATVERDFARAMVALRLVQADGNGNLLVPEVVEWRAVQAGVEANIPAYYLDERAVETLAEQLEPLSFHGRNRRDMERHYEETRNELRNVANQLQETRDRNDDLREQNRFLQRTVRWLEQELRDAHRERRGGAPRPEPTPSAFAG
jgi:chromosome segregation ATPase